jgi:hypothetical protein
MRRKTKAERAMYRARVRMWLRDVEKLIGMEFPPARNWFSLKAKGVR